MCPKPDDARICSLHRECARQIPDVCSNWREKETQEHQMQVESTISHVQAIVDAIWAQYGCNLWARGRQNPRSTREEKEAGQAKAKEKRRRSSTALDSLPVTAARLFNFPSGSPT